MWNTHLSRVDQVGRDSAGKATTVPKLGDHRQTQRLPAWLSSLVQWDGVGHHRAGLKRRGIGSFPGMRPDCRKLPELSRLPQVLLLVTVQKRQNRQLPRNLSKRNTPPSPLSSLLPLRASLGFWARVW